MKKLKVLSVAFAIGTFSLMANNGENNKFPPANQKNIEVESFVRNEFLMSNNFTTNNKENNNVVSIKLAELKYLQEETKLEAIKKYKDFMPEIVGKE